MRVNYKIFFAFIKLLIILGCQNFEKKEKHLIEVRFGKNEIVNDSLSVKLELSQFTNWRDLVSRTTEIVCNDSIPKVMLRTENRLNSFFINNPCWKNYACILIKEKNTIKLHNDSIGKYYSDLFPLDSVYHVLKRDVQNNGINPGLSDNAEKLLIIVSYSGNNFQTLPKTLDKLTQAYQRITNSTEISIMFDEKINIPPPPPPLELTERFSAID